jgi:hypothetical protein
MAMKSYFFNEKFMDLVALSEYGQYADAFGIEFENLMAAAMADETHRKREWILRLKALQVRQAAFKNSLPSLPTCGRDDVISGRSGNQAAA